MNLSIKGVFFLLTHPYQILIRLPFFRFILETRDTQTPITFKMWYNQKIKGSNKKAYWPMHPSSLVTNPTNVYCGIETCPGYMPGCYIQATGKIYIGDYTQIAANVGLITANHDIYENRKHIDSKDIHIGKYSWIGMNSVVLPGVTLGDYTIVGAGSIVANSFSEGYVVIAGNPAKVIRHLDRKLCRPFKSTYEYNGYIKSDYFKNFRKKSLKV
ncbi:MAG: acyltransferase [Bacteroidetes bacterium]|nr:acyltransferase [Bacteroidota bacterium]